MFAKIAIIRKGIDQRRAGQNPTAVRMCGVIMSVNWSETAQAARVVVQTEAQGLIVVLALVLIGASLAAAFGLLP